MMLWTGDEYLDQCCDYDTWRKKNWHFNWIFTFAIFIM